MNNITKYRTELMGLAILWIMLFHSHVYFPNFLLPLAYLKAIGYSGVDIFFLVSGIGLIFSISKNKSVSEFYKRRLIKIIPTYWICLFFYAFKNFGIEDFTITSFVLSFAGFDFFILGQRTTWFIPAILFCYLFFPFYYSLSLRHGFVRVLLAFSAIAILFSILIVGTPLSYLLVFTVRIPIFCFGCYIGLLLIKKEDTAILNNLYVNGAVFFISLAALIIIRLKTNNDIRWATGLGWYPTIIMAFPLSVIIGFFLSRIELKYSFILIFLRFFGTYSLELYLLHFILFNIGTRLDLKDYAWNLLRIPESLIMVICSLLLSILLNRITGKVSQLLTSRKEIQHV